MNGTDAQPRSSGEQQRWTQGPPYTPGTPGEYYPPGTPGYGNSPAQQQYPLIQRQNTYDRGNRWLPPQLEPWFIVVLTTSMFIIAITSEVLLSQSQKRNGFRLPNLGDFGGFNWAKSVVPTIVAMPISFLWLTVDQQLVKLQPYVVLSQGNVNAKQSVLLDYSQGRLYTIRDSWRRGHWIIFVSSVIYLANMALSPIATGILTTKLTSVNLPNQQAASLKAIGLDPNVADLDYFLAASGFTTAAVLHGLDDPPFLWNGSWAVSQFGLPEVTPTRQNEVMRVPTTAIRSIGGCEPADTVNLSNGNPQGSGNWSFTGTWDGCTVTWSEPNNATYDQYGVRPVANCQTHPEPDPYKPVLFYFYSASLNKVDLAFCKPQIQLWNILADADLTTQLITLITPVDQNVAPNNISGPPTNGVAMNGISFDTDGLNYLIQARALAIQNGVPGAIYKAAQLSDGGLNAVYSSAAGFVPFADQIYTQFLAVAASSAYFVGSDGHNIDSTVTGTELRLFVYAWPAHFLAISLVLIALAAIWVHWSHYRARQNLRLAADPTTIAAVLSVGASPAIQGKLQAGMTEKEMAQALAGYRFDINPGTGQVEALEVERPARAQYQQAPQPHGLVSLPYEVTQGVNEATRRGSRASLGK